MALAPVVSASVGKLTDLRPASEPSARERRRQETETALLTAGRELFARQGFEDTSVADIAERAGVSLRTFYRYFPAKEWIACHGLYRFTIDGVEALRQRPVAESPIDSLIAVTRVLEGGGYDDALTLDFRLSGSIPSVAGVQHLVMSAAQDDLCALFAQRLGVPATTAEARFPAVAVTVAYETSLRIWWSRFEAGEPGAGLWDLARDTLEMLRPSFDALTR
jgi:AcrR family transcriptional regulator